MAGIYVHIPFCKQQCTYCDFHFSTTFSAYREEMISKLLIELTQRQDYVANKTIETIYFGGGTPSILSLEEITALLDTIYANYAVIDQVEISLEANPDDITVENLLAWKDAGINRLSIGLQSFKAEDLEWMNRAHTVGEALNCVELAKKYGFENLTVDLMYGLPDLSPDEWQHHIQTIISMDVPHISAYCLTIEEKTVLHNLVGKGKIVPASEDTQSDQFMMLLEILEASGYQQYEISNFSKPEFESKHNSNYWKGEWYLGVGPSAHSFNGVSRRWNVSNNQRYMKAIAEETSVSETEMLTKENQFNERILTGLRTMYGVNLISLNEIIPLPAQFMEDVSKFVEADWMNQNKNTLFLTKEGRLRADHIASELFV
ncbi:MAG: oxygen-independent coproporphyrinogen-3 oxidase [Crocinitomicaceae bacterium]|jgi:oxygen-independent coproporphyrinogen-3 oxidase